MPVRAIVGKGSDLHLQGNLALSGRIFGLLGQVALPAKLVLTLSARLPPGSCRPSPPFYGEMLECPVGPKADIVLKCGSCRPPQKLRITTGGAKGPTPNHTYPAVSETIASSMIATMMPNNRLDLACAAFALDSRRNGSHPAINISISRYGHRGEAEDPRPPLGAYRRQLTRRNGLICPLGQRSR
jgi:hypothetical protein